MGTGKKSSITDEVSQAQDGGTPGSTTGKLISPHTKKRKLETDNSPSDRCHPTQKLLRTPSHSRSAPRTRAAPPLHAAARRSAATPKKKGGLGGKKKAGDKKAADKVLPSRADTGPSISPGVAPRKLLRAPHSLPPARR